jgi:integrase/recombinase XerD
MSEKPISPLRRRMIERHERAQLRREDAQRLYPARQDVHSLPRPLAGYGYARGSSPFSAAPDADRRACAERSVAALRFFFTVTLDRPEMARHLTLVREPHKIPVGK